MAEETETNTELDEEEDLFGQDDDAEEPAATKKRKRDTEEDEDLFGQEDDGEKKRKGLLTSELETDDPPPISEKEETFELDRTPSDVAVSSPVPRKAPAASQDVVLTVPRKTAVSPPSRKANEPVKSTQSLAAKLNLPESIVIPDTLDPALLSGTILSTLRQLPPSSCNDALQEYDDAVKQQKNIRSHGAYLFGVLKRYLSVHERSGGEGSMGYELTPLVQSRLDQLVRDRFCTQDEMNDKVKGKIRMLSEKDALFAIDEFSSVDRGSIRNVGSYFMGILNRYMRGDRVKGRQGPDNHGRSERRRERGAGDDRDHGGRREIDSRFGDDRQSSSQGRERLREARDPYRNVNDRSDFDHQKWQYGHQQQEPPPHLSHYGQQRPPPLHHSVVPSQGYQPPGSSFVQQQNQQASIPPPPHRSPYDQQQAPPPHHSFVPNQGYQQAPGSSLVQQHIPPQSNSNHYQQPPIAGHHLNNQSHGFPNQLQMPGMMPGIINPGYAPPPSFQGTHQRVTNSITPSWQPQQQGASQPDIVGIAAKAAQALAASQNVAHYSSSGYQLNQPPPMEQFSGQPQLHSQDHQQSHQFHAGFQPQENPTPQRRGKTTAMMHELPISVQFVVQNLQTVGHISGPLDEGILGMIKDLPEPMALEGINRFASLDKSGMRNPTAYLAGMLRRELEKINRR